jgi:hypothetical protein
MLKFGVGPYHMGAAEGIEVRAGRESAEPASQSYHPSSECVSRPPMAGIGSTLTGRQLTAFFAVLALALQILVPPGFMVARSHGAPAIVLCTGHGPLMMTPDKPGKPDKSPQSDQGHVCVFAGHGGIAPAPTLLGPILARIDYVSAPPAQIGDLRPGQGLAAPPPPSQGPPFLST